MAIFGIYGEYLGHANSEAEAEKIMRDYYENLDKPGVDS